MNRPERIGIFGGSFDPVHNTHCDIARSAIEDAGLDRVVFVVAARPPHKREGAHASAANRYAMVRAAVQDDPRMDVSAIEMNRKGPSYTIDTLREFHRQFPEAELFLILGFDSLLDLPKWKDSQGILASAQLLVAPRPGGASSVLTAEIEGHYTLLPLSGNALSSTEVREQILAGARFSDLVPPAVEALIRSRGIYHADYADSSR